MNTMIIKLLFSFLLCVLINSNLFTQDVALTPYSAFQTQEKEKITALAFSNDGKIFLSGDDEGNVICWNIESKSSFLKHTLKNEIIFLSFFPDDYKFIAVDITGNISIFNISNSNKIYSFEVESKPNKIAFSSVSYSLAIVTKSEKIEIFDLRSQMKNGTIDANNKTENILFFGFDISGQQLVSINEEGNVFTWDPFKLKLIREIKLSGSEMHGSKSSLQAASKNRASTMFLVGLEEVAIPKGGIKSGKDLLRDNSLILYDWNTGFELKKIKSSLLIKNIALGPGDDFASVTYDENNNIDVIDLRKGEIISTVSSNAKPLVFIVSNDNRWLGSGSIKGEIFIWKMQYKGTVSITQSKINQNTKENISSGKDDYFNKNIRRWAVVVGISKYKYSDKGITPLQFADKDAQTFYDFIKSPQGGGFSEENMKLLLNEDATYSNIRRAINSFLSKAIEDDIVIIYFAGHGSPDPNNPKNLFFITHDTDPDEMASTGYLMDDLKEAMNRFIKARNVLIFTDACHSAGVSGQYANRGKAEDAIINRYILELATSESSNLIFTASEVKEFSKESTKWGNGHGVFTWSLLEGLKGEADENKDGIVSLGELIDYTLEKVKRETQSQQHPTVSSTNFDRNLPMSVLKGEFNK